MFAKANGSRSHASKHEFQSWIKLGCRPISVWNTKHGYSFGTQKFANKRTTCKTLGVFNRSWNEKKSMDKGSIEMSWLHKEIFNEGDQVWSIPKKGDIHVFQTPFVVQKHWEERNPRDKLQLLDLENSSTL
jgi:hypothetical protein